MFAENSLKCDCEAEENKKTAPNNTFNPASHCCLKQNLWSMLRDQCFCDVCFVVGEVTKRQKIYAHKSLLSASSPVFEAMFSDRWSSSFTSNEIEIPDIEPPVFLALLRFIYTEDAQLTAESVVQIQYAARKYAIFTLEYACAKFLRKALWEQNADSICKVLAQAVIFRELELVEACLKSIDIYPEKALNGNGFTNLNLTALQLILERDSLEMSEVDLFQAVLRWSSAECERRGLPTFPENQNSVLEDATSLIRFPVMTQEQFTSSVVSSKLLSDEEVAAVSLHFDNSKRSVNLSTSPRSSKNRVFKNWTVKKWFTPTRFSNKPRAKKKMPIFVKTKRDYYTYRVAPSDTVESLKRQIQEKQRIPADEQLLTFIWSPMKDDRSISDYNIMRESTVQICIKGPDLRCNHYHPES